MALATNEVLDGLSKKAIADMVYDMLPAQVGSFSIGMVKLLVSRERFEELMQTAYDKFDENYHGWQDDLAQEFERWKQLQTG